MLSTVHLVLVALVIGVLSVYVFRGAIFGKKDEVVPEDEGDGDEGNFVERLTSQGKRVVIFFGSQTGTAEGYSIKIAREIKSRYGTSPLVLDPDPQEMD